MNDRTTSGPAPAEGTDAAEAPRGGKPGRPRKYASDADRVRAFRARQKAGRREVDVAAVQTATPGEAIGTLERTLTDLRTVSETALEQVTLAARQIAAAVDRLTDPAALDGALHRASVELAQTTAAYETEVADLRGRLDAAVDDRANADAAVAAVDTELAEATALHRAETERVAAEHRAAQEELTTTHEAALREAVDRLATAEADADRRVAEAAAESDRLRTQLHESQRRLDAADRRAQAAEDAAETARDRAADAAETADRHLAQVTAAAEHRIADLRAAAEGAAAAAASTITRLEHSLDQERAAAESARTRFDALRDELEHSRVEEGRARTAEAAFREQLSALRQAPPEPDASTPGRTDSDPR